MNNNGDNWGKLLDTFSECVPFHRQIVQTFSVIFVSIAAWKFVMNDAKYDVYFW